MARRYSGRKLTARERAKARRLSQQRAQAREHALAVSRGEVPHSPVQVNPGAGERGYSSASGVRGFGVGAGAAGSVSPGGQNPFLVPVEPESNSLWARFFRQWGTKGSNAAVVIGLVGALVAGCVGLAVGAPVLEHEGRPLIALLGAAGVGGGGLLTLKGWGGAGKRLSWGLLVGCLLLGVSFTVGTVTNPVVIDGKVVLATSPTAQSFKLAQDIREDLLWLADVDDYLMFNPAQAGSRVGEYPALLEKTQELTTEYSFMTESLDRLPADEFMPLVQEVTSAAYWANRAVESKVETIEANNARSQADLASHRAVYGEALLQSGQTLREVATALELPWEQMGPQE